MNEAIFDASVILAGYGALSSLRGKLPWAFIAFAAWPLGCFSWIVAVIAALAIGTGAKAALSLHLLFSVVLFALGLRSTRGQGRLMYVAGAGAVTLFGFAVGIVTQKLQMTQGSYDSFELIALGRSLLMLGFRPDASAFLASWGVLVPLLHAASVAVKVEVLSSVQPLFFASLLGLMIFGVKASTESVTGEKIAAWPLPAIAAMLFLGSTYSVAFQSVYIHNSLPSAVYLMVYFIGILVARNPANENALWAAGLGLLGFTLCRTEAPLFAAIAMISGAYLLQGTPVSGRFSRILLVYTAIIAAWYGFLSISIEGASEILTPGRAILQVMVLFAVTVAIGLAPRNKALQTMLRSSPEILVGGSILIGCAAFAWKGDHLATSTLHVFENMFFYGFWGSSWAALAIVLGLTLLGPASRLRDAMLSFGTAFFVLLMVLAVFRDPYRLGWGDSANRIFTHLVPVLLMGATAHLIAIGRTARLTAVGLSKSLQFLLVFLAAFAVAVPLAAHYVLPENVAADAVVMKADGFCPKNSWGEYGFDVALRPPKKDSYTAACDVGERNVVIQFSRQAPLRWIAMEELKSTESWTDFAIHGSNDLQAWVPLYDTRTKEFEANRQHLSPVLFRINISDQPAFRYLRVQFRAAAGQNRLLLRKFEVYADR